MFASKWPSKASPRQLPYESFPRRSFAGKHLVSRTRHTRSSEPKILNREHDAWCYYRVISKPLVASLRAFLIVAVRAVYSRNRT